MGGIVATVIWTRRHGCYQLDNAPKELAHPKATYRKLENNLGSGPSVGRTHDWVSCHQPAGCRAVAGFIVLQGIGIMGSSSNFQMRDDLKLRVRHIVANPTPGRPTR